MGNVASRDIYNKSGTTTGPGLNTLEKNQGAFRETVGALPPKEVTIQDGSITSFEEAALIVDTEGGAAADDLYAINDVISSTEKLHPGMLITLRAKDPARVVTVKNSASANGINTADGKDIVLSPNWELTLRLVGGKWYEVRGRTANTGAAGNVRLEAMAVDGSATAAPGGYGLGTNSLSIVTDLNLAVLGGSYRFNPSAANSPIPTKYGWVYVQSYLGAIAQTVISSETTPLRFIRIRANSVWGPWNPEPTGFVPTPTPTANAVVQARTNGRIAVGWVSGLFVGKIELLPFRASDLTTYCPGWYFCNGDKYDLSSAVGQALNALPTNYKSDWGIVAASGQINLPKLFTSSDGRGYFFRGVDGIARLPGSWQIDTMQALEGGFAASGTWNGFSGAWGAFAAVDTAGAYPNVGTANGSTHAVTFQASRSVRTSTETVSINLGMTPAIFLDV